MGKKRIDYGLTDESRTVINGHSAEIADEFGCVSQYIYGVLAGDNPDPFAYFLPFYQACVRAGVEYRIYDDRLAQVRAKYRTLKTGPLDAKVLLIKKIGTDASTTRDILQALDDGNIDEKERRQIRADLEDIRRNCDLIDNALDAAGEPEIRVKCRERIGGIAK